MKQIINNSKVRSIIYSIGRFAGRRPWMLEFSFSISRRSRDRRSVRSVALMSLPEKFDYGLRMYNLMLYNPAFTAVQPVLNELKSVIEMLSDVYYDVEDSALKTSLMDEKHKQLNRILSKLHHYVEHVPDKDAAFILSAGMQPYAETTVSGKGRKRSLKEQMRKFVLRVFL